MKNNKHPFQIALVIAIALFSGVLNAAVIQHDIGTGNLIIPGNSTDDYVITGSTTDYYVEVGLGYHGSITLQNCTFSFSGWNNIHSPIRLVGQNGQSNDDPLTVVNLILDGTNTILNNEGGRACIQVDQGTQINISAIDPCDNNSGILIAQQLNDYGGAAIGSLDHYSNSNETTATAPIYDVNGYYLGYYSHFGMAAHFWSSTVWNAEEAYHLAIGSGISLKTWYKEAALSVRCLRN